MGLFSKGKRKSRGQGKKPAAPNKASNSAPEVSHETAKLSPPGSTFETAKLTPPNSTFETVKLDSPSQPAFYLDVGSATDRGRVREYNEDSEWAWTVTAGPARGGLFVVADGMGGHAAGDVASRLAVQSLERLAQSSWPNSASQDQVMDELARWVQIANKDVFEAASSGYNGMGTTVTAALILEHVAYVANVGDSRTYLWRTGSLQRITRDHSLVMSLVEAQLITPEEIYTHPRRNEIYRALGLDPTVDVDVFGPIPLVPGDRLLLCCDGLWEMVHDPEIQMTLGNIASSQAAAEELVRLANAHGGEDNISVVIVTVKT